MTKRQPIPKVDIAPIPRPKQAVFCNGITLAELLSVGPGPHEELATAYVEGRARAVQVGDLGSLVTYFVANERA